MPTSRGELTVQIDYYARYFAFENDDWWFVARRRIVFGLLGDALARRDPASSPAARRIVDVGAGTGITLGLLRGLGSAVGIDLSPDALRFSRLRGNDRLLRSDMTRLAIAGESVDVVTCLDGIEHVDDDRRAVAEIFRICRPGGIAVITVPAFPFLWSEHDVINHHKRRYGRGELETLVRTVGFDVELLSFYNFWLAPLAMTVRLLKRAWTWAFPQVVERIEGDNTYLPRSLNWLLARLFGSELALLRRMPLPFGISLVCVLRRPADGTRPLPP